MFKTLLVEHRGPVALITLNRPEQLNAYTVQMGEDLVSAFDALGADTAVRAVVLTGAGRAFCAGVDLKVLQAGNTAAAADGLPALGQERFVQGFAEELYHFPKPVIAAINGAAVGVGLTMTLPCDIRIAAKGVKLALPFAKLGIVPGLGSSFLLPRLVGLGNAKILTLTGGTILSDEAFALGLIDRLVALDELLDTALGLAQEIAANAPEILGLIKETLNAGAATTQINAAIAFEHAQNARRHT